MNPLDKLVGLKVNARIEIDEDNIQYIFENVRSVDINDYSF